ncbi:bifunctional Phosphoenolpyruvate carboxykinase [Babesia duncani]|uniref:phosphoenolpyruvate carboxykinase (ATP) n=1 Tax=Babesia duncani TaxID=323732 RepID=A0AAD9UQ02_9APIC|nr:bifunctional Phosphoenolpyruvate carboxykinase [Babesia duncani]
MSDALSGGAQMSSARMTQPDTMESSAKSSVTPIPLMDIHLKPSEPEESYMTKDECITLGEDIYVSTSWEHDVSSYGIHVPQMWHNPSAAKLYKHAMQYEKDTGLSSTGALCCFSGEKTGRSPSDKRIVLEPSSCDHVWWGSVNIPISEKSYLINRERAIDYINLQDHVYVIDGYAGWDPEHRVNIRTISTRPYHALFMSNMLIRPSKEQLATFVPDFVIYNAGAFPSNRYTDGMTSKTSICLHYGRMEMVILGSEYAGEMKKGVLTLMMYMLPLKGLLPLHSSCNVGPDGSVSLFFGLSGTGKTTLSTDPARRLIGDDEHVWTEKGVYNIEGGCYAKCKDLSRDREKEIFDAIRFGAVMENVILDQETHLVDYTNISKTENTRVAYPLEHIENAMIPAVIDKHPDHIIFLTCDAFGVLNPISKLTVNQAMYHFVSGYTSKMVGTEMGVTKPTATFSACYGGPFLALHPMDYAKLLAKRLHSYKTKVWLVNTGWIQGSCDSGHGKRIPLEYTRRIIDAIHSGELDNADWRFAARDLAPTFGLEERGLPWQGSRNARN